MVPDPITDHVARGLARLTSKYASAEDAPQLQALISSYLAQVQEIEDALWDALRLRQIANLAINPSMPATMTGILGSPESRIGVFELGAPRSSFVPYSTNPLMDVVGALVGQPRDGACDLDYLAAIYLRIAVNRSNGSTKCWSQFASILLRSSGGPAQYQGGAGRLRLSVWEMRLNSVVVARVLGDAVANGVYGEFAYSTWPDGGDFALGSRYDMTAGQCGWGSRYSWTAGGLLVALSALPPS